MPYYLTCRPNGAVRFSDTTPTDIIGIGTQGLVTCTAIFLIGEKKVSLIHIDKGSDLTSLKAEQNWVGDIKEIKLVKNTDGIANVAAQYNIPIDEVNTELGVIAYLRTQNLIKKLTQRIDAKHTGMVFMDRASFKISHFQRDDMQLQGADNEKVRHAINFLNSLFMGSSNRPIDLEFDSRASTPMPALQLKPATLLKYLEQELHGQYDLSSIRTMLKKVQSTFKTTVFFPEGLNPIDERNYLNHFKYLLDFRSQPAAAAAPRI